MEESQKGGVFELRGWRVRGGQFGRSRDFELYFWLPPARTVFLNLLKGVP